MRESKFDRQSRRASERLDGARFTMTRPLIASHQSCPRCGYPADRRCNACGLPAKGNP